MSSGSYGKSFLDVLDIETDPIATVRSVALDSKYFGEGVTYLQDKGEFLMMTYKQHKAFRFNSDLELLEELTMPSTLREGWGMTHIEGALLVSDSSSTLYYVSPVDFSIISSLPVKENGRPVRAINELEHVNGKIYANVFQSNDILVINLDGTVEKRYDFAELIAAEKVYL